jgi:hypothetical protein
MAREGAVRRWDLTMALVLAVVPSLVAASLA